MSLINQSSLELKFGIVFIINCIAVCHFYAGTVFKTCVLDLSSWFGMIT